MEEQYAKLTSNACNIIARFHREKQMIIAIVIDENLDDASKLKSLRKTLLKFKADGQSLLGDLLGANVNIEPSKINQETIMSLCKNIQGMEFTGRMMESISVPAKCHKLYSML